MSDQFAIRSIDVSLPMLGEKRLNFTPPLDPTSHITVLVGRNGTGKSTILREIAMSFRQYFAAKSLSSRQGLGRITKIHVDSDQRSATLDLKLEAKAFRIEREALRARELAPNKLIALSFTPFDKFPPADDTRDLDHLNAAEPFYIYLGFKSDFRASPRARLLRSIDQLAFAAASPNSDTRAGDAFWAIGYVPVVRLNYDFGLPSGNSRPSVNEARVQEVKNRLGTAPPRRDIKEKPAALSVVIDFDTGLRDGPSLVDFEEIRQLTRERVLRLVSVSLERVEGGTVELLELSSGELNLLSGFLGLAAFLENGCVVLIDEPENSLHPEWQLRYVEMLEAVLQRYSGCHYILATHSPLVVSGVAGRNATVLRLDQEPVEISPEAIENASPDATLLNAFKVVTAGNNFLKQLVLEALTLIETGAHHGERARAIATFIASLHAQIPDEDPLKALVASVVQAIQR